MPEPMIKGSIKERWEKSAEDSIGLPVNIIRDIFTPQMSFYLQNRNKIDIRRNSNGNIECVLHDSNLIKRYCNNMIVYEADKIKKHLMKQKELIITSFKFSDFLDRIGFREPKNDGNRFSSFMYTDID